MSDCVKTIAEFLFIAGLFLLAILTPTPARPFHEGGAYHVTMYGGEYLAPAGKVTVTRTHKEEWDCDRVVGLGDGAYRLHDDVRGVSIVVSGSLTIAETGKSRL